MREWLERRLPISAARAALAHKTVPVHRWTPFYFFGGMTLFFFGIQIATGLLLTLYYRPSADEAFESVELIVSTVPFGWLVRSVHAWSANLMVFSAVAHLASTFFLKAWRAPRELTWISGCVLLFLTLGFGFSGYLLPWNQLSFFATQVGTDIAGSLPIVGDFLLRFLRGGDRVAGPTLARFYAWHVVWLPGISLAVLAFHLLQVQMHGMSVPPSVKTPKRMPFVPHFAVREAFGWTIALGALGVLAALFPWELGEKADPFAPAYRDIRPEWYFMFLFETLKLVPGGEVAGIEYEAFAILATSLGAGLLVAVPFLDRRAASRTLMAAGALVLAYAVALTAYGYRSWLPIAAVVLTGGVTFALGAWRRP